MITLKQIDKTLKKNSKKFSLILIMLLVIIFISIVSSQTTSTTIPIEDNNRFVFEHPLEIQGSIFDAEFLSLKGMGSTIRGISSNSLIGYWNGNGNTLDYSGYEYNGTLNGDANYSDGISGTGFEFDGSGDYVDMGDIDRFEFQSGAWSVSTWVKFSDLPSQGYVVSKGGGSPNGWALRVDSSERPRLKTNHSEILGNALTPNVWHHLVGTYNGTVLSLYVNGSFDGNVITTMGAGGNPKLTIGALQNPDPSNYFNGFIDEVMIFERELSATEISALYTLGQKFTLIGNELHYENDVHIGGKLIGKSPLDIGSDLDINGTTRTDTIEPFTDNLEITIARALIEDRLVVQGSESIGGYNATIELENTATGGDRWFLRAGATGTPTPAGGFSIADTTAYRFVIDQTGKVGIGNAVLAPNQQLHVLASGSSSYSNSNDRGILITDSLGARLVFEDSGESTDDKVMLIKYENQNLVFGSINDVGDTFDKENILVINRDGFVGIGTTSPNLPLEVRSADDNQGFFFDSRAQAQGVGGGIAFGGKYNDAGGEAMAGRIGTKKTNSTSGDVGFDIILESQDSGGSMTTRMLLTSDGKVGIGEITPTKALDVDGDTRIRGELETDNGIIIGGNIQVDGTVDGVDIANDLAPLASPNFTGNITFPSGIWNSSGYVGIGTASPHDDFHIRTTSPSFVFEDTDATNSEKVWEWMATGGMLKLLTQNDLYTGSQTVMSIDRGGTTPTQINFPNSKVAIGTEIISGKLTVDQSNTGGVIPVLTLDQADVSEPWIEFLGGTISTGKSGQNEYLEVKVGGNTRYLRLFN